MHAALPLLERAGTVSVAVLSRERDAGSQQDSEQPDLVAFLASHRVTANIVSRKTRHDSGLALLALAKERGCGMLVMGCYGHSRLRERCLGGASRTVLCDAAIPVLMNH